MSGAPLLARTLGWAGVLPLLPCVAVIWWEVSPWIETAQIAGGLYSGVILSFLGGTWWSIAAAAPAAEGRGMLGWVWCAAVIPSLIVVAAGLWWLIRPAEYEPALVTLAFSLMASPLVDSRLASMGLTPRWWLGLRWPLSLILGLATLALAMG